MSIIQNIENFNAQILAMVLYDNVCEGATIFEN